MWGRARASGGQLSGMKGCLDHARWAKDAMDETAVTPGTNNMCNAYVGRGVVSVNIRVTD